MNGTSVPVAPAVDNAFDLAFGMVIYSMIIIASIHQ